MKALKHAGLLALFLSTALPLSAQQPPTPRPEGVGPRILSAEAALRLRDELKLTEAQQSQLEAIRKEIVAQRQNHARDRIDLESRLAAGLIAREDIRKQFEGHREAMLKVREERRERVSKILTQEQQDQLNRTVRAHMRDRMHQRRGRHFGPGMRRGRGFGEGHGLGPGLGLGFGPGIGRDLDDLD